MFWKRNILAICILTCFFLAGLPMAHSGSEVHKFIGKVKYVDFDEKSLVVGGPNGDMVVYIENTTRIKMKNQAKSLKDVKVGGIVEVHFQKDGDDNIGRSIIINP